MRPEDQPHMPDVPAGSEHVIKSGVSVGSTPTVRTFDTGATRSPEGDKLDYEGFLSPIVLEQYAKYMHKHRKQADGKLRASDNWQKGIPIESYMKSMWRHFFDVWRQMRGGRGEDTLEDSLCALMFNVSGMLHEYMKQKEILVAARKDRMETNVHKLEERYGRKPSLTLDRG